MNKITSITRKEIFSLLYMVIKNHRFGEKIFLSSLISMEHYLAMDF